jgi:hypothetical protein
MVQSAGSVASGAASEADARAFAAAGFDDDFAADLRTTDFDAVAFAAARFAGADGRARTTAAFFAGADFFPALRRVVISTTSFRSRREAN